MSEPFQLIDDGNSVYRCPECEFRAVDAERVNRHEEATGHRMPISPDVPLNPSTWLGPNRPKTVPAITDETTGGQHD